MKIKHEDIEITVNEPFKNCKLGRLPYAIALTNVVATYADGFVLSINNPWGTGKTTFIKMWKAHLDKNNFRTLYFNAWENDFDNNPLVALMSELGSLTNKDNDLTYKSLITKASVLSQNILPALAKAVASKYLDSKVFIEILENATKGATEILKNEIDDYAKKKAGLIEFRNELKKYINEQISDKPLVLIIDELDRCRPNYAVEVLEQIKHFFNVPGIVFVLSIDKEQLGNAIKGVYGSDQLNSTEYLRRFIDLEFMLPQPSKGNFCTYLFEYFDFSSYFHTEERKRYQELSNDDDSFLKFASLFFEKANITLRQQEKIFSSARVVLNTFTSNNYIFPTVYLLLIYIKDFHTDFYFKLQARQSTPQEIMDDLKKILPLNIHEEDLQIFLVTEVLLVKLYHNYFSENVYDNKIVEKDENGKNKLLLKSIYDQSKDGNSFLNVLESINRREGGGAKLSHLLNKISLMDNFK